MGFTSPESIIQLSSCELSQPGHVAQEASCTFGERRPLWLPPLIKSTTFVAPQEQGSTSTGLAGDEWCKNRLWRDGGGVSSSVSLFHKLCIFCWYFFEMRIAGVPTVLVVYSLHITSRETTKSFKIRFVFHAFFWEFAELRHGFSKVCEYDKAGLSPLCYAALGGHLEVLEALLSKRANPNESVRKPCPGAMLMKGQSALAICVRFGNNEATQVLLQANADPNQPDCTGNRPLSHSFNAEGARLLLDARADASAKDSSGANALLWAAGWGATEKAKELYNIPGAAPSLEELLHWAILIGQASTNHIEMLLSIGCDINEQFCLRIATPAIRLLLRILAVKHSLLAPTPLSTFAYHHRGATPLMASIFLGYYAIAVFLLEAKARIDLCNSRKQTAFDLAVQQSAPDALLWNLWKRGAGSFASPASVSWWCAHTVSHTVEPEGEGMLEDDMDDLDPVDPMISMNFWFLNFLTLHFWNSEFSG